MADVIAFADAAESVEPGVFHMPESGRSQLLRRVVRPQIGMANRPTGVGADPVETSPGCVFYAGGPVGGNRHRLQQLNQRSLFLAGFLGAAPLADVAQERVIAASAFHSNWPNRGLHGKLMPIAMQRNQFD